MPNPFIPDTWYVYDWPLAEVNGAPVPSSANYDPRNVAPLIESFAQILGKDKSQVQFRYENNTPRDASDDVVVSHPNDQDYLPAFIRQHKEPSPAQLRYEAAAKSSARLSLFQDNSPANIKYFR